MLFNTLLRFNLSQFLLPPQHKVPIKWMAPEQLNKAKGQKRLYNKKTDVWSYGVVVWEIFSKGFFNNFKTTHGFERKQ